MRAAAAIVLAAVAASLYALSTSLQALGARDAPTASALRASLLTRLARQRSWLLGGAAGVAGWGLQAAALAIASVALVQPALGLGLVVLLVLGARLLGETVGRREIAGGFTVAAGVAVLGWAAPSHIDRFTHGGRLGVALALVAVVAAPYGLRIARRAGGLATSVAAGLGWAWVGLGTDLVDRSLGHGSWIAALAWAVGVGLASWSTLLSEMTALQVWPATRSWPVTFSIEMAAPAALAPVLTRGGIGPHGVAFAFALAVACAGAVALAGSSSVARTATSSPSSSPGT